MDAFAQCEWAEKIKLDAFAQCEWAEKIKMDAFALCEWAEKLFSEFNKSLIIKNN